MERILVAIDGSDHAEKALQYATKQAERNNAQLIIAHVRPDTPLSDDERRLIEAEYASDFARRLSPTGAPVARGEARLGAPAGPVADRTGAMIGRALLGEHMLAAAAQRAREGGARQVETILAEGDPAEAIISAAQSHKADALVVGSRGLGQLGAIILGSVSEKVIHDAPCTVIVVK